MRKILLILFILTFSFTNAQIIFEKGYFIDNAGKKTECFIKNLDWRNNPITFEYKINNQDTESLTGTISTIQEFGIDNISKYKRYKVNIEKSVDQISQMATDKNPIWKQETIYLKMLIEGDATLFFYTEGNAFKYFFETKNTPIEQLICIKYINTNAENGSMGAIYENNQFRQQLFNTLKCGSLSQSDFKNLNYDKSSLIKVFKKYNTCTNPDSANNFEEKAKKNLFSASITPSFNYATVSVTDPDPGYDYSTDFNKKMVFKIGAELEYTLPFNKNKWSIFINPAYQKYKDEKKYSVYYAFGSYNNATAEVEYSSIEIPVGVRHYFFLNQNSKIFVNGALVFNYIGNNAKINFDKGTLVLQSGSRNNFAFGVGYKFRNKFSIELRTNTPREIMGDYMRWSSKYNSTGLVLGYRFAQF